MQSGTKLLQKADSEMPGMGLATIDVQHEADGLKRTGREPKPLVRGARKLTVTNGVSPRWIGKPGGITLSRGFFE